VIERAEVLVLTHRLSRRRDFGTGSNLTRDSVVVRLEDRDGHVGWGETYLVPGVVEAGRAMAGGIVGQDADRASSDLAAAHGLHRWALGAVSMAVDDLRARRRDVAVAALYGERLRGRVRGYASSRGYVEGMSAQAAWLEEAGAVWDDGFRAMKLRIGRDDPAAEMGAIESQMLEILAATLGPAAAADRWQETRRRGDPAHARGRRGGGLRPVPVLGWRGRDHRRGPDDRRGLDGPLSHAR